MCVHVCVCVCVCMISYVYTNDRPLLSRVGRLSMSVSSSNKGDPVSNKAAVSVVGVALCFLFTEDVPDL